MRSLPILIWHCCIWLLQLLPLENLVLFTDKFLIDGEWKEDPGNEQTCPNCFGTMNSILNLS